MPTVDCSRKGGMIMSHPADPDEAKGIHKKRKDGSKTISTVDCSRKGSMAAIGMQTKHTPKTRENHDEWLVFNAMPPLETESLCGDTQNKPADPQWC